MAISAESRPASSARRQPATVRIGRLGPADVAAVRALRICALGGRQAVFRFAAMDEANMPDGAWVGRLADDIMIGAWDRSRLVGMGGFTRERGERLRHKGLLWGFYVEPLYRNAGVANSIVEMMLQEAGRRVECVLLTVVAGNGPAIRLYRRWGFEVFATEPRAVRFEDGRSADKHWMRLAFAGGQAGPHLAGTSQWTR